MSTGIPTTWPALFGDSEFSRRMMHERCEWLAGFAGESGRDASRYFSTMDVALACIAVLEGPEAGATATRATQPIFEAIARDLAPRWYTMSPGELIDLIVYQHVATAGGPAPEPRIDIVAALQTLAKAPGDCSGFEARLTLTALAEQCDDHAGFLAPHTFAFKPGAMFGPNFGGFVHFLRLAAAAKASYADVEPAWQSFALLFPRMLAAGNADYPDLVLAASVVHHRFGGHALDQTIARLHDELRQSKHEGDRPQA